MTVINLLAYPKFNNEIKTQIYPLLAGRQLSSSVFENFLKSNYNIECKVNHCAKLYQVEMTEKDLAWFLLKWG